VSVFDNLASVPWVTHAELAALVRALMLGSPTEHAALVIRLMEVGREVTSDRTGQRGVSHSAMRMIFILFDEKTETWRH
jgi:hypothetical protein